MELIERYVYAVTSHLPSNQREDVEKELKSLIDDMLSGRTGGEKPTQNEVEAVLLELGQPSRLADSYRGARRYLVGPENFDTYLMLLKIVGVAVTFGLTLALVIGYIVDPPQHLLGALGNYVSTILSALAGVFAWLTITFAVLEHYGVKTSDLTKEKEWRPADLPQVPAKAALIRPLEPVMGIVFTVLFIILLNAASQLIGIYSVGEDTVTVIPLLNREVLKLYLPYFNVLLFLVIVKEALKLVTGKWTIALAGLNSILNVFSLVLVITALSNAAIWNEGFFTYLAGAEFLAEADTEKAWKIFIKVLMGVIAFALVVDTISSLARALKHKVAAYL